LDTTKEKTIYIVSGPCGVGKSTDSKELSRNLKHTALIAGDDIMSMIEEGYEMPWEEWLSITWKNILSLTRNFVQHDLNVVIDQATRHLSGQLWKTWRPMPHPFLQMIKNK
jgi:cytidylate kinase